MMASQGRGCGGNALASCAVLCLLALPASAQAGAASPAEDSTPGPSAAYRLIDFPFGAALRSPIPGQLRLEATTTLAPRHEVRFSTWASGGGLESFPGISLATLTADPTLRLDPARATYRYTFLTQRDWAWKLGVSANMREMSDVVRPGGLGPADRLRFGSLPLLHVAGEGRLASRWRLAVDADGLMTPRGRTFDLGLRVNYSLTPNFLLFGGYRLTDSAGEAEEFYGSGVSNAASVGLRYRF